PAFRALAREPGRGWRPRPVHPLETGTRRDAQPTGADDGRARGRWRRPQATRAQPRPTVRSDPERAARARDRGSRPEHEGAAARDHRAGAGRRVIEGFFYSVIAALGDVLGGILVP